MNHGVVSRGDPRPSSGVPDDRAEALKALLEQVRQDVVRLLAGDGPTPCHVRVTAGDVAVEIEWGDGSAPVDHAAPLAAYPATEVPPPEHVRPPRAVADTGHVTAPTVGVFHLAPGPAADPFVRVGEGVLPGQRVGSVEAMNVMVPVEADRAGTVVAVLKGDRESVEYGEPLLILAAEDA